MTPDLSYLAWSAFLTAVLWIPYIVGQVLSNGMLTGENYRDPTPRPGPLWVQRANRAHINSVETLAPFAVFVLILHATNGLNETTATLAMVFFWARLAHAIVYLLAVPYLRTLLFTVGFICTLGLFWQVIA